MDLVGKPKGKQPLRRCRHRWENGIEVEFRATGWSAMDWIHLAQDMEKVAGSCGHGNGPSGSIKCSEILE
jgi:hypothetical protein